jgi:hypothetical protein
MEASDFEEKRIVSNITELEGFLRRRYVVEGKRVNSFFLTHSERYPCLLILVNEDLASLWYTPAEDHPGFITTATEGANLGSGTTMFYLYRDLEPTPNSTVVALSEAIEAAKEFFGSDQLPRAVQWEQL